MGIKALQVTKLYGEQKALNNVSFDIKTGQIVGFLGPNGAGKSTMMKIITGFLSPTEGEVFVEGLNVADNPIEVKRLIGYLPEHNPLYLDMYVKEYLAFVAGIYKMPNTKQRVAQMVEMTGLTDEQHKKIGALSKGYRQRVGLAQALIHDPKVLILDEPTSGLDPNQIVEIRNLIIAVGKEKTILLSTHIMQEVEAICQNIIILNKGSIIANDKTANVQHQSQKNIVIHLEFNMESPLALLEKIEGVFKVKAITSQSCLVEAGNDVREKIFQLAVQNNLTVLSMQKKEKSLEQVFQELTK